MKTTIIEFKTAIIALLVTILAGVGAKAQTPAWTVNPSDYRYDMSLYMDVAFKSQPMDYSEYIVAAFVGDECRGIAEPLDLPNGKQCLYMRVRSNRESGETLTFKYRNKSNDEVAPIEGVSLAFESNGRVGYPSDPWKVVIERYYDVTVEAGQGGSVSETPARVAEGTELTLTATPAEGHYFDKWSDGNTDNPRVVTVNDNISLSAEFGLRSYKLTYTVDGEKYNETEVEYGTALTAIAEPVKEGHTFSGWTGLPATMPAQDVTVTGTFTINTYKATFKIGDEFSKVIEVVYGQPVVAPAAPEKEGHTFAGWGEYPQTMPARDITVTGTYTVNKYKLTYTVDGTKYNEAEVEYGTALTAIAAPVKEGYTFSGWTGLPATMPAKDVTVTGTFTINTYKATFKIGEDFSKEIEVVYGQPIVAPSAPDKVGHTFAGWEEYPATMPAHDITVNGSYTVNKYKLTYTVDGAKYNETEVEYGTSLTAIAEPVKEGYTFSGWTGLPATMPAEDVTVTGTFTINTYKATFKIGEETVAVLDVVFGQPVVAPAAPEKEGHTFAGWGEYPQTMPARDITVTGTYTVNKYKLTYTVDGAKYNETEVEYGTALTAIAEPVKEGHTFSGWTGLPTTMPAKDVTVTGTFTINTYKATFKIGDEFSKVIDVVYGQPVVAPVAPEKEGHTFAGWGEYPQTMPAHDITVEGSYTVNKYKLNYVVDEKPYKTVEVEYGATIVPEVPVKEGYTFSGWTGLPDTMPAKDVTVAGTFTINTYKATFKIGDEFSKVIDVVYGQPVVAPAAPEKEGHTFAGWGEYPQTMPAHDITVEGRYTVNKYKLNYVVDGEPYKTVEVEYGATIVPEVPVKEGYTFSGWTGLPETMPAKDVTATGTFTVNTYKATFKIGDDIVAVLDVVYGESVVAPSAPDKVGHTFAGWEEYPATMPAHDITVNGSYTVNKYKLNYVVDGEPYKTVEVEYGATIVPEVPVKEGYTFSGWTGLPETMPAEDVTVSGTFSINTYKATFKIGEETVAVLDVVFGQPVVAPSAPEKEGHTFAGWGEYPQTMPAHDITVMGSYTVNKYKLNYVVDGEPYKTVEVEYGTVPTAIDEPEKEGYTFSGWTGLPETMPAEDVTVTGTFTINSYKLTVYLNDEIYLEKTLEYGAAINIPEPTLPERYKFEGWKEEIPETMPAHDVTIHGTYIDVVGIDQIEIDDDETVWVCTISGTVLYAGRPWSEVKDLLRRGIYIINGAKYLIH